MTSEARHVYGPRPAGALVADVTRPAFRRRAPAAAQIMTDWPLIVGPAIAGVTGPRRLRSGILTIGCAGPIALELQHLTSELTSRINHHLGAATVTRLRFVQDLPPPQPAPEPPAAQLAATAEHASAAAVPPGPLRDALAALGRAILVPSPAAARQPPNPVRPSCS